MAPTNKPMRVIATKAKRRTAPLGLTTPSVAKENRSVAAYSIKRKIHAKHNQMMPKGTILRIFHFVRGLNITFQNCAAKVSFLVKSKKEIVHLARNYVLLVFRKVVLLILLGYKQRKNCQKKNKNRSPLKRACHELVV